ncbi:MAG: helix-turn-helix domain-containing protein [Collinsella sp.]|nr:helix-turn-helix domain-containing protein [Collinsella sp.]
MKLRTVIDTLACTEARLASVDELNLDVAPGAGGPIPGGPRTVRILSCAPAALSELSRAPGEVIIAHVGAAAPAGLPRPPRGIVAVAHEGGFDELRRRFDALSPLAARAGALSAQIYTAFQASAGIRAFAAHLTGIIGNPLIVSNTDRRVIAHAGTFPAALIDVETVIASGYVQGFVEDRMREDGVIAGARRHRRAAVSVDARSATRWVSAIIYYKGVELGRLDVLEAARTITPVDLELVDYAASLMGLLVAQEGAAGERAGTGSSILADLLTRRIASEEALRSQLMRTQMPLDETYVVVVCRGEESLAASECCTFMPALTAFIGLPCLWTMMGDTFVLLASIGAAQEEGYHAYARARARFAGNTELTRRLEENGMRLYVSEPFERLALMPARLDQATSLAGIDAGTGGPAPVTLFWERRFAVMAAAAKADEEADALIDKRVLAMGRYDHEHGTSYFDTAVASVRTPGAPARAAAMLCVHRNTYFYRVEKIRALFDLDLKDGDDRLAVAFTARVLEALSSFPMP